MQSKKKSINFICESFQLDTNKILNTDAKLKESVVKLFLGNFKVLATHPSQYSDTEVLEMKITEFQG